MELAFLLGPSPGPGASSSERPWPAVRQSCFQQQEAPRRESASALAAAALLMGLCCSRGLRAQKTQKRLVSVTWRRAMDEGGYAGSQVAESMRGMPSRGEPEVMGVGEVYRLLKSAPNLDAAIRLAARLRRAAKDGRALKDGRLLSEEKVDEATDEFLMMKERKKGAATAVKEEEGDEGTGAEVKEAGEAVPPWRHSSFGPERVRKVLQRRKEAEEAQEAETGSEEDQGGEDRVSPWESKELSDEAVFTEGPAGTKEERIENVKRDIEYWRSTRGGRPAEGGPVELSKVPQEFQDEILCKKFNYVDRVWSAREASLLPRISKRASRGGDLSTMESWLVLPHIVMAGMTNCGKSTLINHLVGWNYASKASSRAGKTTNIDFLVVNKRFVLVDLPGYADQEEIAHIGVMKEWEKRWEDLVFTYLDLCATKQYDLRLFLQLQHVMKRPSPTCKRFAGEATDLKLPHMLILTKDDKLYSHEARNNAMTKIKRSLSVDVPHVHYTCNSELPSSRKARKQLIRWIRTAVSAKSSEEVSETLNKVWAQRARPDYAPGGVLKEETEAKAAPEAEAESEVRQEEETLGLEPVEKDPRQLKKEREERLKEKKKKQRIKDKLKKREVFSLGLENYDLSEVAPRPDWGPFRSED